MEPHNLNADSERDAALERIPNHKKRKREEFARDRCNLAPNCGCHGYLRPEPNAVIRHEREHTRRLAWCVQNGRTPAHEHVHEAPGDDSQFVYGVPPWNPDGSVNPAGVYFTPETENEKLWLRLQKEAQDAGWACPKCNEWIARVPVQYRHGAEPWDWWFCFECKAKAVKPSQKVLREQMVANACLRLESFAGFGENVTEEDSEDLIDSRHKP